MTLDDVGERCIRQGSFLFYMVVMPAPKGAFFIASKEGLVRLQNSVTTRFSKQQEG